MECPYCNEKMRDGTLFALRRIAWTDGEERKHAIYAKEGELTLAESLFKGIPKIGSSLCEKCGVLITKVKVEFVE